MRPDERRPSEELDLVLEPREVEAEEEKASVDGSELRRIFFLSRSTALSSLGFLFAHDLVSSDECSASRRALL